MPVLKWGCCIGLILLLFSCTTASQMTADPQGRPPAAPSDVQSQRIISKDSSSANASTSSPARNGSVRSASVKSGPGPVKTGKPPSLHASDSGRTGAEVGTSAEGPSGKPPTGNGADNTYAELEEEVDEIVALLRQAQAYRNKGEMDNALKVLDKAYGILLDEEDESSVVARQKDDLRLMIARSILDIYTGRRTSTVGKSSEIPLIMNADVEKEIRSFQTVERNFFERSYERSGYYLPIIKQHLRQAGLPEELAWLPLVESGFQVSALSRARALGPWQFIPSTGYKYGLNRDLYIDERMSVEKSTQAAIAYLTDLHGLFGDWLTALAAYNCGEGRVLKVISRQQINYLDHFWDLYQALPYETARYVPRFLATVHIVKNPKKYGLNLAEPNAKPIAFETVKTYKPMKLSDVAGQMGISADTILLLNPELRHQMTPDRPYDLRLPQGFAPQYALIADQIKESRPPMPEREKKTKIVKYKVKKGDTVASVAKKYGTTPKSLMAANGMKSESQLTVGTVLKVPAKSREKTVQQVAAGKKGKAKKKAGETADLHHTVQKGETLTQIAKRYHTTPNEIKQTNNLSGSQIRSGQVLKIRKPGAEAGG